MHHFFPGIPETQAEAFAFFAACGWTRAGNWGYDLWRDLDGFAIAPNVQSRITLLSAKGVVLRGCSKADVPALIAFLEAEFPGGWLYGASRRLEVEPDATGTKIAVRDGAVIAFAQTFSPRSVRLGPSIAWREQLGSQFAGLGPMGVAVDARGLGVGLALLAFCVAEAQRTGATRMAIDWTEHLDFYARLGFAPWKRYGAFSLPLDD
jgi:predicted N-acetyltransferase YhbS